MRQVQGIDEPLWLTVARELQAIGQAGMTFSKDPFDLQRFHRVRELSAQMMASASNTSFESVLHLFTEDTGYPTPKVDVRGAAFADNRILLVRETADGRWALPGGWADVNQSAAECVVREIAEESGYQSRAIKLAAVWDYSKQGHRPLHPASIYKMFFICEIVGGCARPSDETSDVAFFPADALPPLSGGRTTDFQIQQMFAHAAHPERPADFD
jgi:ADP-ribose pyrophosphatase YjhB (NUDIX family)